jgi:hypothetical protein
MRVNIGVKKKKMRTTWISIWLVNGVNLSMDWIGSAKRMGRERR